jgi:circadian clock protein KaiB
VNAAGLDHGISKKDEVRYFRLYVAGQSAKSMQAIVNLKDLCDSQLAGRYDLEIVDLIEFPHLARIDDILAIPTLVLRQPPPERKIVGDLSDRARVLACLRIQQPPPW